MEHVVFLCKVQHLEQLGILKRDIHIPLFTLFADGHSHLTLTVRQQGERKSLDHPSKVAEASGVHSAGIGQGTQQVIGQIAATFL